MLFLLDSNIAITSDPLGTNLEAGVESVLRFLRLAGNYHHDLRTHPASLLDFARIPDPERKAARLALFERYVLLRDPPPVGGEQRAILGTVEPTSNSGVDQALLAAVIGNAVEYLVTQDEGLHRAAVRMGVADRVLLVADALAMLATLHAQSPAPPPAVQIVQAHRLDPGDAIFEGLREDYPDFDGWLTRSAQQQRDAFLINGLDEHAAVCILKPESEGEHGIAGPLLKLATFKVAPGYSGQKYGELLLKAAFEHAAAHRFRGLFLTVFDKHEGLIALLEQFGFNTLAGLRTTLGERVMAKPLRSPPDVAERLAARDWPPLPDGQFDTLAADDPFKAHVRFGPPYLDLDTTAPHLIPIEPRWHRLLFPDAEPVEDALFPAIDAVTAPFGNALRKAYLCKTPSRTLNPGDPVLFYRSGDEQAVHVVGVCESTLASRDPDQIAAEVGQRTVYSLDQITAMTEQAEVLVVVFRQDRILRDRPISLAEARAAGLVRSHPQSIMRARSEGLGWLRQRLDE